MEGRVMDSASHIVYGQRKRDRFERAGKDRIHGRKNLEAFKTLFLRIADKVGGIEQAKRTIGLASTVLTDIDEGNLTVDRARKIKAAYDRYCE